MMTLSVRKALQAALGVIAGLLAWPFMELLIHLQTYFPGYLAFTVTSGAVFGLVFGAILGSSEGMVVARTRRIVSGSLWGALAGAIGGALGFLIGQGVLFIVGEYLTHDVRGVRFVALPLARAAGWAVLGAFVGMSAGLRAASFRKAAIGILGGIVGGIVGGAIIEYGLILFPNLSLVRAFGLLLFGALLGLSYALVEHRLSFGILRVLNGRLKGREYLLNQRLSRIGEDPHCDIVVSGYHGMDPVHAIVSVRGRDLVVESMTSGVKVNDVKLAEGRSGAKALKFDDVIACGAVRFLLRRE